MRLRLRFPSLFRPANEERPQVLERSKVVESGLEGSNSLTARHVDVDMKMAKGLGEVLQLRKAFRRDIHAFDTRDVDKRRVESEVDTLDSGGVRTEYLGDGDKVG